MNIMWYTKKENGDLVPNDIEWDWDNDWLDQEDDCATMVFNSLEELFKTIKVIYPYATYSISINNSWESAYVTDFNSHLENDRRYWKKIMKMEVIKENDTK